MEQELLPLVQQKLKEHKELCAKHGLFFNVTSTYRTIEDQDVLYKQGRENGGNIVTNAKGGQSYHNWRVAYDVVPILNGKNTYDEAVLRAIGYFGTQVGLEWGGDFKTFPDLPHFQLSLGYATSDFASGLVPLIKFGVNSSPQSISALPEHVRTLLQATKDFQVKEGLLDFAGETDLRKVRIGARTLLKLAKYQK